MNHRVLSSLTKDTEEQMVYTFYTVPGQNVLGPGLSLKRFEYSVKTLP